MEEAPLEPVEMEEYPAVEETEDSEEPVTTPAPKKQCGRPQGSKNKALDVYAAIIARVTQLEETMARPAPQSSTGATPETPRQ